MINPYLQIENGTLSSFKEHNSNCLNILKQYLIFNIIETCSRKAVINEIAGISTVYPLKRHTKNQTSILKKRTNDLVLNISTDLRRIDRILLWPAMRSKNNHEKTRELKKSWNPKRNNSNDLEKTISPILRADEQVNPKHPLFPNNLFAPSTNH